MEPSITARKYSKLIEEIEQFIELKKRKSNISAEEVEAIDFNNKNLTSKLPTFNQPNVVLERLTNIIENIKKGEISPANARILGFIIGENKPHYIQEPFSFISKKLNGDQKDGVSRSIKAEDFHLIIGPPGTGKTYVIEELIRQFRKRNQKILVTAWTNFAVDNIIKRLPKKETKNIVRIGPITEINSKVRKLSIFQRMEEHEDWPEVEKYNNLIEKLSKLIPTIKNEINLGQDKINRSMGLKQIFNKDKDDLITEKIKYDGLISISPPDKIKVDFSTISDELSLISIKSENYLSLSRGILQMNELQAQIPGVEFVRQLRKLTRSMKYSILGKGISFFIAKSNNKGLEKLKQEYEENRKYLDEISILQKKYAHLKKRCEEEFNKIYPAGKGLPDEDALNLEFNAYELLENKFLPSLKEEEMSNMKMRTSEVNKEVYGLYVRSLNKKLDLLDVRIKSLNTEIYLQIKHKEDLSDQLANLSSSLNSHKKNAAKLKKSIASDIIGKADLIAATVVSSRHYFLNDIDFDVMIMDEATQVASFMSLLPLLKCKKFILVGDNKQLQPIEEEEISAEMNMSIFNRLFGNYPEASTFLSTQYRMHKSIAKIANEFFYEGKLRTSEKVADRVLNLKAEKNQILNPKMPVLFVDTSKVEYYEDEVGSGCSNQMEANYVADVVSQFIKKGIKKKDIGIVTPYVKQKILIEEFLNTIKIKGVEVDTAHKFQGREKDIIIISFARSKKYSFSQYKLKFIENETLVNVSITRAKKKLILVGNYGTLSRSKLLKNILDKMEKIYV